jgi:hypothetical protein
VERECDSNRGERVKGRTILYVLIGLVVVYFVYQEMQNAQADAALAAAGAQPSSNSFLAGLAGLIPSVSASIGGASVSTAGGASSGVDVSYDNNTVFDDDGSYD